MKLGDLVVADGPLYTEKARTIPLGVVIKKLGKMRRNGTPSAVERVLIMYPCGSIKEFREWHLNVFVSSEDEK